MKIFKTAPRIKVVASDYIAKIPLNKIMLIDTAPAGTGERLLIIGTHKEGQISKKIITGNNKTKNFVKKHYITLVAKTDEQVQNIIEAIQEARKHKHNLLIQFDKTTTAFGKQIQHSFEIIKQSNKTLKFKNPKKESKGLV